MSDPATQLWNQKLWRHGEGDAFGVDQACKQDLSAILASLELR